MNRPLINPVEQNESMQALIRMRECHKFFQEYCETNPQFTEYFRMSFTVAFKFACDFLEDLDMISQDVHHDLTCLSSVEFADPHFKVNTFGFPELRFHYACTFSNIVIQLINQLKIDLK